MMVDGVYAQAALLAGKLEDAQAALLRALCNASGAMLASRLKEGVRPEDCRAEFILAASLYALADLSVLEEGTVQEFRAGDLTVKQGGGTGEAVSRRYQRQAEALMAPFLKDRFAFLEV